MAVNEAELLRIASYRDLEERGFEAETAQTYFVVDAVCHGAEYDRTGAGITTAEIELFVSPLDPARSEP